MSFEELEEVLGSLTRIGPAKVKEDAISLVKTVATRDGLYQESLTGLMTVICGKGSSSKLALQDRLSLVRCLIPRTTVPMSAVFQCLGSMHVQPGSLQRALFRWLVLVFDLLEDGRSLTATYDLIFHFLQYDSLRPAVAQLLCYMTTREHVKGFRVERLLDLCRHVMVLSDSSEDPLLALLSLYRFIAPHLTPTVQPPSNKIWFKLFEKDLFDALVAVQSLSTVEPRRKRVREKTQRSVLSPHVPGEVAEVNVVAALSLASMDQLCQNIQNVKLSGSMSSLLDSPLLPHLLSVWAEPAVSLHLSCWLQAALSREVDRQVAGRESSQMNHLLQCVADLSDHLLELVPGVEAILSRLLCSWNGEDYARHIFHLLPYLPLQSFAELKYSYLEPLEQLMVTKTSLPSGRRYRHSVLCCVTNLLHCWARTEWQRYQELQKQQSGTEGKHGARLSVFVDSVWNRDSIVSDLDPVESLTSAIAYFERLVLVALEMDRGHPLVLHAAASFYQVVTSLPVKYGVPVVLVPRPHLVYLSLLHLEPSALSRTLPCYIKCLKNIRESRTVGQTNQLNTTVLDLCDALWKCRAFIGYANRTCRTKLFTTDPKFLEASGIQDSVATKLSVFNHPALLAYTLLFIRNELKIDPVGCTDFSDLITEKPSKVKFLDFLCRHKLPGLADFITTFIVLV